jgi:hypothetical protein
MLNGELTSNIIKQRQYDNATNNSTTGTGDFEDATEDASDAVADNTLKLEKNTQAKLNNISISNESIAAMLNLVNAIQRVTEIQGREAAEQEKLNKLIRERTELQKILNEEAGKGEQQTAVELAQIEQLRSQEAKLLKQQRDGLDLKLEIASAELDLEDAILSRDEKGEEADARDDLNIKQQRARLEELKNQQATSKDVTIELAQTQANLQNAIEQSTMATQKFMQAQTALDRINVRVTAQQRKRDEAAIDTDAERLELTEAKLALEAATLTAQDRNVMKEARATLARVMGLDTRGINDLFASLGLDLGSFGRIRDTKPFRQMLLPDDKQFLPEPPPNNDEQDTPPPPVTPTTPSLKDFLEDVAKGGGGVNAITFGSQIGSKIIDDSAFDLGNPNSAASRFRRERDTIINVVVDSALDAEVKTQKQMDDFYSRLQVNNRFRVL